MNLLLETMTPLKIGNYSVRVWREESLEDYRASAFPHFDKSDLMRAERELNAEGRTGDPVVIAERLIALPNVNTVEVLDPERHGCVLYKEWP